MRAHLADAGLSGSLAGAVALLGTAAHASTCVVLLAMVLGSVGAFLTTLAVLHRVERSRVVRRREQVPQNLTNQYRGPGAVKGG